MAERDPAIALTLLPLTVFFADGREGAEIHDASGRLVAFGLEPDIAHLIAAAPAAPDTAAERDRLKASNAELVGALEEIEKARGPFNMDPLEHAINCIESMREIARAARAKAGAADGR